MEDERKKVLLDIIKNELCNKTINEISTKSIEKIADILNLDINEILEEINSF